MNCFDITIAGVGPGGYAAAPLASQRRKQTVINQRRQVASVVVTENAPSPNFGRSHGSGAI